CEGPSDARGRNEPGSGAGRQHADRIPRFHSCRVSKIRQNRRAHRYQSEMTGVQMIAIISPRLAAAEPSQPGEKLTLCRLSGAKRTCMRTGLYRLWSLMMLWTAPTLRHQGAIGWLRRNETLEGCRHETRLARTY